MARFYPVFFGILFLLTGSLRAAPIQFVQNRGQWAAEVLYRADLPGGYLYLLPTGLHYAFYDADAVAQSHARVPANPATAGIIRGHGVTVRFDGCRTDAVVDARQPIGRSTINYFLGDDPTRWAGNVPAFGEVTYRGLYPGVDLRVYTYYQTLKYEFIVRPGTDPAVIRLVYDGADRVRAEAGQLIVETSVTQFRENKPYAYVSRNEHATEVRADWLLTGNMAQFQLPNGYDKTQVLTLDPELVFATYSGSRSDNWGHTATYDKDGNLYSAGTVFGANFPVTRGAFQTTFGGEIDLGILKFSPDGKQLLYATYLGGRYGETPNSLVVNGKNELIIYGITSSDNFPTTAGAYDRSFNGGITVVPGGNGAPASATSVVTSIYFKNGTDLFLSRLSSDGKTLVGSTFVGGSGNDGFVNTAGNLTVRNYGDEMRGEVAVDSTDQIYVATTTNSPNFPTTAGATQKTLGGTSDGVVLRLSADLKRLDWSTYLGGSGFDALYGLALHPTGALYVCGVTKSDDLPTSKTALNPNRHAGAEDGFAARFDNQNLTGLTYLGTTSADAAYLMDVDRVQNVYVFGLSVGAYPVEKAAYQNPKSGQFIHALDANLSKTVFSTVIGSGRGNYDIVPTAFLVNECGNIYLSGWGGIVNVDTRSNLFTSTSGLPVTADAYKKTTNGSNFWVALLERGANSLLYATYMGSQNTDRGDHVDGGTSRFSPQGVIYHAVCACGGTHIPTTAGAWSATNNSDNCNNLAFKFDVDKLKANFDTYQGTKKGVVTGCTPLTLTFQNTSLGGRRYEWLVDGNPISTDTARATYTFNQPGQYVVKLRAYNPLTCQRADSVQQLITVSPADFRVSPDTTICPGASLTLRASGATQYLWTPATGLSSTTIASPTVQPSQAVTYTVSLTNAAGCTAQKSVTVRTDDSFRPLFSVDVANACGQSSALTFTNGTRNADRYVWRMGNGDSLSTTVPENYHYVQSGPYSVTLVAYKGGCSLSVAQPVMVENLNQVPNVITPNGDGKNDFFNVGLTGGRLDIYNRWGSHVYHADSYANNWGTGVINGLYYYLLITPSGTRCKGWVEVIY